MAQASAPAAGATSAGTATQEKTSAPALRAVASGASRRSIKPQGEPSTASLGSSVPANGAKQKCAKSGSVQLAHAASASAKNAPQQDAKLAGAQPLQERNAPSHGTAAPAKALQQTGAALTSYELAQNGLQAEQALSNMCGHAPAAWEEALVFQCIQQMFGTCIALGEVLAAVQALLQPLLQQVLLRSVLCRRASASPASSASIRALPSQHFFLEAPNTGLHVFIIDVAVAMTWL